MELEKQMPGKPLFAGPFRNDGTQSGLCSPGSAEFPPLSPYSSQIPLVTPLFQEQALYLNSFFFFWLHTACGILISLTRDGTHAHCSGSLEY